MIKILLCDEGIETLKILSFIIEQKQLGEVIDELGDGNQALELIKSLNPDLVIIDYELEGLDGNEVVRRARECGYRGKFIMISEVYDNELVTKAYDNGITFFIRKPINFIETIHLIRQTGEMLKLERMTSSIYEILNSDDFVYVEHTPTPIDTIERELDQIFVGLGLQGCSGSIELKELVIQTLEHDFAKKGDYVLTEQYEIIAEKFGMNPGTVEQKIRRAMMKSMEFIATKGLEDYDSLVFERYASTIFDFSEVRKHMNYMKGKTTKKGMLQVKKYVEGLKVLLTN